MTQEDVISNTKTVIQGLEALKIENNTLLNGIRSTLAKSPNESSLDRANYLLMQEKAAIIEKSISSIELGLNEAQVMIALQQHLQTVEADRQKLRAQAKRLSQENAWLRDELSKTQQKLMEADKDKITLEQENKHLKFNLSLKEIDGQANNSISASGGSMDDSVNNSSTMTGRNKSDSDSALELGFPDEYDVHQQGNQAENVTSTPNTGYEIPARIRTLHNLVIKYAQKGRYEVAVPLCKQALEDLEKTSGPNHPDFATMLNILALVYRDQQLYREATQLLNEALQIREKTLGPDDPGVAATLNNLAVLYGKRGMCEEAIPLCQRALAIREKRYGPDHPDVAKQLNNLALLYVNLGKSDEVHRYYSRAIEIYEKALGPTDPIVYKTKNNLASTLIKKGDFKRADAIYKEIINRAHEKEFGKITEDNKPIWQIAEEREGIKGKRREDPPPALEYGRIPIINET